MIKICYCGSWADHTGYGEANRNFIAALDAAGVQVTTERVAQVSEMTNLGWMGQLCSRLERSFTDYDVKVIHLTPDIYHMHMEKGKYHIGHLFWETDKLPQGWAKCCNKMDEIWTASEPMADIIRDSGVEVPVYAFPQPIDIPHPTVSPMPPPGDYDFIFYSIFQWTPRKNPAALLEGFWKAFSPDERVALAIKTFRLNYGTTERKLIREDIASWQAEVPGPHPPVHIYDRLMSRSEMWRFHAMGDCFVLPHSGEGWNRCILEAITLANPVIATNRLGIHDYLTEDHYYPLPYTLEPIMQVSWIPYYEEGQHWAEVDPNHVAETLRYVYDNQDEAKERAKVGREFVCNNFSLEAVGGLLKSHLERGT